jgi:CheY-like chemotaxis protein
MDHMMPEMDGFEAVAIIRSLGGRFKKLPIVALTANTVIGMKDMFLKNGFDDFLAKPIEIPKLDELLGKWIPAEKRVAVNRHAAFNMGRPEVDRRVLATRRVLADRRINVPHSAGAGAQDSALSNSALTSIDGLNVVMGIATTGGKVAAYKEVLKLYCRSVEERVDFLSIPHSEKDIKGFTTFVHSLKSASATIGAKSLSEEAAALESAGLRGDMAFIREHIDGFRVRITGMTGSIAAALAVPAEPRPAINNEIEKGKKAADTAAVPLLVKLKAALEAEDVGKADGIQEELSKMALGSETSDALAKVSDMVLTSEFGEAAQILSSLIDKIKVGNIETAAM